MDPLTLMLLGSGLGAAGNIGGGLLSSLFGGGEEEIKLGNMPATGGVNANANPAYSAALLDILSMLGAPSSGVENQASPVQVAQQAYLAVPGLKNEHVQRANTVVGAIQGAVDAAADASEETINAIANSIWAQFPIRDKSPGLQLGTLLSAGGYGNLQDLIREQMKWKSATATATAQRDAMAPTVQAGRNAARTEISRLLQDFPSYTATDIERLSEVERQKSREAVLQAANVGGFNPAAGLAEVERDTDPIARAVALLGGAQGLASNSLTALNTALLDPNQQALAVASLGLNTALQNSSLTGQQAAIFAGLNQNRQQNGGVGDLASGLAGGLGQLGGGLTNFALFDMLNTKQPGTNLSAGGRSDLESFLGTGNIW